MEEYMWHLSASLRYFGTIFAASPSHMACTVLAYTNKLYILPCRHSTLYTHFSKGEEQEKALTQIARRAPREDIGTRI